MVILRLQNCASTSTPFEDAASLDASLKVDFELRFDFGLAFGASVIDRLRLNTITSAKQKDMSTGSESVISGVYRAGHRTFHFGLTHGTINLGLLLDFGVAFGANVIESAGCMMQTTQSSASGRFASARLRTPSSFTCPLSKTTQ